MRSTLLAALVIALVAAGFVYAEFRSAVDQGGRRITGRSALVATSAGPVEYAVSGTGPQLMMIHGTGGGFDQGLHFSEAIAARGFQIIAPSRFGYLRSSFPADHSSERQADILAELLDQLKIGRIAVGGGSAGALSAVQFALRHPDRTSALILIVPAANVRGRDPVEMSPTKEWLVRRALRSDFLFWTGLKLAPAQMTETLLATDPRLLDRVSAAERTRAKQILERLMPISARWRGMLNDAELAGNPSRVDFSAIRVPTLVISAEDDRFGTAATARDIAAAVPGARLVMFNTGGHIWVGHNDELADAVANFLRSANPK